MHAKYVNCLEYSVSDMVVWKCVMCVHINIYLSIISCSNNRLEAKDIILGIDTLSCYIIESVAFPWDIWYSQVIPGTLSSAMREFLI